MYSDMGIQNRRKLVSAANHIMNNDPCRMWMYGVWKFLYMLHAKGWMVISIQITIEGEDVAIWYFSRSHSVMSKSFDFAKVFMLGPIYAPHD